MRSLGVCFLVVQFCGVFSYLPDKTFLDSPENVLLLRTMRLWALNLFGTGAEGGRLLQNARDSNKIQTPVSDNVPFPCNVSIGRSKEVPSSVRRLRPGDIDVIASMGDSLTAGAGIFGTSLLHVAVENRGVTATGGGQGTWRQYLTIPNIIREFNPNLIGYARGDSLTVNEMSELNVAESAAMSRDLPYMTEVLIQRIKRHPKINLKKHWKFITLMIGPNDFCSDICYVSSPWSLLDNHRKDLLEALRMLRDNLPRTLVNVIPPPNLKLLVQAREGRTGNFCDLAVDVECSCLFGLRFRSQRSLYYEIMKRWQDMEMEIASYPEFQRDDFAVVAQPVTLNITIPKAPDGYADMSYFSADCFHISQKMNARYANALWNALLSPMEEKSRDWDEPYKKFLCPTSDSPYFTTPMNSQSADYTLGNLHQTQRSFYRARRNKK